MRAPRHSRDPRVFRIGEGPFYRTPLKIVRWLYWYALRSSIPNALMGTRDPRASRFAVAGTHQRAQPWAMPAPPSGRRHPASHLALGENRVPTDTARERPRVRPRVARASAAPREPQPQNNLSRNRVRLVRAPLPHSSYLVDPASSHTLVSKIKPCMSKYNSLYGKTANGSLYQL